MTPPDFPAVVVVSAFFPRHGGGIERVAGHLSERLARAGFPLHWFAGGPAGEAPVVPVPGLRVTRAASIDLLERTIGLPAPLWSLSSLRQLYQAIGKARVVHIHDCLYLSSVAAFTFAKVRGKKILITQHIGTIPFRSGLLRFLHGFANRTVSRGMLKSADAVAFVSPTVHAYFSGFVKFRNHHDVIFNGVDHETFHPAAPEHPRNKTLKMLFVGRFVEKKGIHLLRGCMDLPGTDWTFVGKGPQSPASWDVPMDNVTLRSDLTPEQLADLYRAADLMVLPSVGEGFPLVVQEALACGLPVLVSSEVAGSFADPSPDGVFIHDEHHLDQARELRALLASITAAPDRLRALRSAAQGLAGRWSWQACTAHYARIIRSMA